MSRNYKIVSIEGNIGSGKSTLLEKIRKEYSTNPQVIFLKEPVEEWEKIKDKSGNTMLKKFYIDQNKYSFAFQMMAYISRLKILRDTIKSIKDNNEFYIIITERCLYTDKYVFAQMLYDSGNMESIQYQIYNKWFESFLDIAPVSKMIYLKTDPKVSYKRISIRNRNGEENIPFEYIEKCHNYHNSMYDVIDFDKKNTSILLTFIIIFLISETLSPSFFAYTSRPSLDTM